jgi:hypothetical protein
VRDSRGKVKKPFDVIADNAGGGPKKRILDPTLFSQAPEVIEYIQSFTVI